MDRHIYSQTAHVHRYTCLPTLRPRCLQTMGWVLSLPHQMLLQKSLLYTSKPHPFQPSPWGLLGLRFSPPPPPPLPVRTFLQPPTPHSMFHRISTPRNQPADPTVPPSPGSRLANPWDPSLHGSDCCMGHTPALPEALRSQKLQPCLQALPTTDHRPNSCQVSPQQGDAYITRARNGAGCKPGLC